MHERDRRRRARHCGHDTIGRWTHRSRARLPLSEITDPPPAPGEAREIAPGILWLRMPLPFALDHVNLWLLAEPGGYTLVDCGYGDATTRAHWQRHFATTLRERPLCGSSRHTAIPIISAMPRGSPRTSAARSR
jgi:hypothetical protein